MEFTDDFKNFVSQLSRTGAHCKLSGFTEEEWYRAENMQNCSLLEELYILYHASFGLENV